MIITPQYTLQLSLALLLEFLPQFKLLFCNLGDEGDSHPAATSGEATITGPVTVSFTKITTTKNTTKREPAIFSTEELSRLLS